MLIISYPKFKSNKSENVYKIKKKITNKERNNKVWGKSILHLQHWIFLFVFFLQKRWRRSREGRRRSPPSRPRLKLSRVRREVNVMWLFDYAPLVFRFNWRPCYLVTRRGKPSEKEKKSLQSVTNAEFIIHVTSWHGRELNWNTSSLWEPGPLATESVQYNITVPFPLFLFTS